MDEDRLNTFCVIKQLLPQDDGSQVTEGSYDKTISLFYQEATQLSKLGEHPHIPTLFAFFEEDGRLYLVQEYVDGQTLWHEMERSGAFSETKIREILVQLLPVLRYVHQNKVIHRDITPVNILRRNRDGKLMLIDFGVSKQLTKTALAEPGTKVGTMGYAPLEQLRSGQAYPASDIYSLGVTCLQLLTNTRPDVLFDPMKGWRWREKLAEQEISLSPRLGAILDKMTQERLQERYQSVDEIIRDFKPPASKPPSRQAKQRKTAAAAGSDYAPVSAPQTKPANASLPPTNIEAPSSQSPRRSMPPLPPKPPSMTPVPSGRVFPTSSSRFQDITPISHRPPLPKTRGWHCAYTLPALTSLVSCVAIYERLPAGKPLSSKTGRPTLPWIVGGGLDNTVFVWNLQTGQLQYALDRHRRPVNAVAISPDGKVLASGGDDATVKLWNLETGELLDSLGGHLRGVTSLAFAGDGSYLISGSKDRTLQIWKPGQSETSGVLRTPSGSIKAIALSPDGRWLVSGGLDNKIYVWNLGDRQLLHTLTGHLGSVLSVAISRDNQFLASGSKDRTIKLWDLQSGTEVCTLANHLWDVNDVAFGLHEDMLISASSDKTIKIWSIRDRRVCDTLSGHMGAVHGIAVAQRSRTIVSGSWDKTIKIWCWHQ
ncbi:serine/threonine protein kinase [Phormidium yuhuli AB48]|uniref:Serine/threonine protein kinase n=1 Tax=Phormidium yuhuli AB48 TaxID=2940671 RepID=A0ABY5ASA2_9CYAN|nr:serine/threonine-protein kinase [Phormidium yuhuli]USR91104.1 serine/threonine protein kinase [Phormidium yuhuli AB48]